MKINNIIQEQRFLPIQKVKILFNVGKLKSPVKKYETGIVLKHVSLKYSNSIGGLQDDFSGNIGHEAKFYPEDIKKNGTNDYRRKAKLYS